MILIKMLYFKVVLTIALLLTFPFCRLSAQSKFINELELRDNAKIDLNRWQKEGNDLKVAFGSIDVRYLRHQVPELMLNKEIKITAWRGERVNIQIVIWSGSNNYAINTKPSDLTTTGMQISATAVKAFPVRYVLTDARTTYSLAPDMLDNPGTFSISGKSSRPIWITIDVPAKAKPAIYKGYIEIKAKGGFKKELHYILEVQDRVLPNPSEWQYHLDLWQHPWAVSRTSAVNPWSKEHWEALRSSLTMLANAGQKCISTTLIHNPLKGQIFDPYESMVDWRKSPDGSWTYDFALFDQWVEFAMSCGIKAQINCYSMIPRDNSCRYFDETDNEYKIFTAVPGGPDFENHWRPFLLAFREHLKNKRWLDKTCIAMDYCGLPEMLSVIKLIKATTPELKIAFAGGYHPEIVDDVFDLSLLIDPLSDTSSVSNTFKTVKLKRWNSRHWPTTFYTSFSKPEHPKNFTFSPLAENTLMGWYAIAAGYKGFLRSGYQSWGKDPEHDARFESEPEGDSYMVYPGARSSIRFERLREGIQDYEKIRILRETFEKEGTEKAKQKLKRLNEMLKGITLKNISADNASIIVNKGKGILNELSR